MTGLKLPNSGAENDRFTNLATTTAQNQKFR